MFLHTFFWIFNLTKLFHWNCLGSWIVLIQVWIEWLFCWLDILSRRFLISFWTINTKCILILNWIDFVNLKHALIFLRLFFFYIVIKTFFCCLRVLRCQYVSILINYTSTCSADLSKQLIVLILKILNLLVKLSLWFLQNSNLLNQNLYFFFKIFFLCFMFVDFLEEISFIWKHESFFKCLSNLLNSIRLFLYFLVN